MTAISVGLGQYQASENHVWISGRLWTRGSRCAIFCHGAGGNAYSTLGDTLGRPARLATADAGVAVMSCDLGTGGQTWGNSTGTARVTAAWNYAQTAYGAAADKVLLIGSSMGGLTALNWARANPTKVKAIALEIPATSIPDIHDNDLSGYATTIETAWGGLSAYTAAMPAGSPHSAPAALAGIPIRAWYAADDPIARPTPLLTLAAAVGSTFETVSMGNVGHTLTSLPAADQAAWLAARA